MNPKLKKKLVRKFANLLNFCYFGNYLHQNLSPSEFHFHSRLILSYMREDECGKYF